MNTNERSNDRDAAVIAVVEQFGRRLRAELELNRRTCLDCFNFQESTETCLLAGARPPARVLAFGCPQYDNVPF